jgi:hypothetical protein
MTQKLILAGDANAFFATESLDEREPGARWSNPPATIIAWLSLLVIVALIVVHSGYWALTLPSWLSFVFMLGATASGGNDEWSTELAGGSH